MKEKKFANKHAEIKRKRVQHATKHKNTDQELGEYWLSSLLVMLLITLSVMPPILD